MPLIRDFPAIDVIFPQQFTFEGQHIVVSIVPRNQPIMIIASDLGLHRGFGMLWTHMAPVYIDGKLVYPFLLLMIIPY